MSQPGHGRCIPQSASLAEKAREERRHVSGKTKKDVVWRKRSAVKQPVVWSVSNGKVAPSTNQHATDLAKSSVGRFVATNIEVNLSRQLFNSITVHFRETEI
jgi:hypothetical protein